MEFTFPAGCVERRRYIRAVFLDTLETGNLRRRMRLVARVTHQEATDLRKILFDPQFRRQVEAEFATTAPAQNRRKL